LPLWYMANLADRQCYFSALKACGDNANAGIPLLRSLARKPMRSEANQYSKSGP